MSSNGRVSHPEVRSLTFAVKRDQNAEITVAVDGDLDLVSTPELEEKIAEILSTGSAKKLVLDLHGLEFMDSTGLRVLWSIRQRALDASCRLVLRSPSDAVMRLLRLTGMHRVFSIEDAP